MANTHRRKQHPLRLLMSFLLAALCLWLPATATTFAQGLPAGPVGIEEEDLGEVPPGQGTLTADPSDGLAEVDEAGLRELYREAENLFREVDPAAALPLFSRLVDTVESALAERQLAGNTEPPSTLGDRQDPSSVDLSQPSPPDIPAEAKYLSDSTRQLLTQGLAYRSWIYHLLGEAELADSSLARMLEVDPGSDLDRTRRPRGLGAIAGPNS